MSEPARRGAVLVALVAAAVLAPWLAPYAPDALDLANRRAAPSLAHWFGTDDLGRDLLSRVLFGARVSLAVGLLSALVAGASASAVGATSGYAGGRVDAVLMRLTDAALSVPRLLLLMVASAVLSPVDAACWSCSSAWWAGWKRRASRGPPFWLVASASSCSRRALRRLVARVVVGAPAARGRAGDCGRGDAGGRPRHPARVGAQLLRRRRAAARRQLGQHALSGAVDDEHRAVARDLSGRRSSSSTVAAINALGEQSRQA